MIKRITWNLLYLGLNIALLIFLCLWLFDWKVFLLIGWTVNVIWFSVRHIVMWEAYVQKEAQELARNLDSSLNRISDIIENAQKRNEEE